MGSDSSCSDQAVRIYAVLSWPRDWWSLHPLLLGVAYKKDVNDVRESPALSIIDRLRAKGAIVKYHDPFVSDVHFDDAHTDSIGEPLSSVSLTNEELQSANEEILSANEELQSTNEELQTAKEEAQSANEELATVNEELRRRNLELGGNRLG